VSKTITHAEERNDSVARKMDIRSSVILFRLESNNVLSTGIFVEVNLLHLLAL